MIIDRGYIRHKRTACQTNRRNVFSVSNSAYKSES
jgi:hypothetical protein